MELPIRLILWAGNNPNHADHLHVEGLPKQTGNPPYTNPGMTPSVQTIYTALEAEFGKGKYFQDPGAAEWTHMGWYNRRKIAGTDIWSQHAWGNALDIGPYTLAEQQKFYDFLTQEDAVSAPKDWDTEDIAAFQTHINNTVIKHTELNLAWHLRNTWLAVKTIKADVAEWSDEELAAVAKAVNDELAKRAAG